MSYSTLSRGNNSVALLSLSRVSHASLTPIHSLPRVLDENLYIPASGSHNPSDGIPASRMQLSIVGQVLDGNGCQ